MTSSTLGEAAHVECQNQKEWSAKELKRCPPHRSPQPLGSDSQLQPFEGGGELTNHNRSFSPLSNTCAEGQGPALRENILGENHYKSDFQRGKKPFILPLGAESQKGTPAPENGSVSGRWAVVCDESPSSALQSFLHEQGEAADSWDPSRRSGGAGRAVCWGVPGPGSRVCTFTVPQTDKQLWSLQSFPFPKAAYKEWLTSLLFCSGTVPDSWSYAGWAILQSGC